MNNRFKSGMVSTLYLLMGYSSLYAVVNWNVTASNAVDEDVIIESDATFAGGVTVIEAINQDIVVTMTNPNVQLNGVSSSRLCLIPHNGRTITLKVTGDLAFLGETSSATEPLLLLQGNQGQVVWELTGDHTVTFGSQLGGSGTEYWLFAQTDTDNPQAIFTRNPAESANDKTKNVHIAVGAQSRLGYLSNLPVGDNSAGSIFTFDPTTIDTGLMQLDIADQGAVIISPRLTTAPPVGDAPTDVTQIAIGNIKKDTLAGSVADFEVVNTQGDPSYASLFIANSNQTMTELLYDPFLNLNVRHDNIHYNGTFAGTQYGYILGSQGILAIADGANIQYVGLDINRDISTLLVPEVPDYIGVPINTLLKQRNASALFCDQSLHPDAAKPTIFFGNASALYLRSGVGVDGSVRDLEESHSYTVAKDEQNTDVAYYLLDVEGQTDCLGLEGSSGQANKIEVLSLEVNPTGGALLIGGSETNFASRTFQRHFNGDYYVYNPGAIFVNGYLKLKNTSLVHTDIYSETRVIPEDDVTSLPNLIGGETYHLLQQDKTPFLAEINRPKMAFESSQLHLHANLAATGLDLLVPNQVEDDDNGVANISRIACYYNGYAVDQGVGRTLLLGTTEGALAADRLTSISSDAHLDVIQKFDSFALVGDVSQGDHVLRLEVAPNDATIVEAISGDIEGVNSQHLIYLGHNSNISVGTNADSTEFNVETHPELLFAGNYIATGTSGGILNDARSSTRTGTGGTFVDLNGTVEVLDIYNCFIGTMVAKSRNATVDLPFENVQFAKQVGVTDSNLSIDVSETLRRLSPDEYTGPQAAPSNDPVIVGPDKKYEDYTVDWLYTRKDPDFVPYQGTTNSLSVGRGRVILPNQPAPITPQNLIGIPTIQGEIIQLQITGSTLGNPAHILIDGGYVHELVFVTATPDEDPAEGPFAVIVLSNGGRIGLGNADRNYDSANAAVVLGRNGVTIVSNVGSNEVILNNSVVADGDGPFIFGPDSLPGDVLRISSEVDDSLVVRKDAALDLRSVYDGRILEFGGKLSVELEANTKVIASDGNTVANNEWAQGIVRFVENTQLNVLESDDFEETFDVIPLGGIDNELDPLTPILASAPHNVYAPLLSYGSDCQNTDPFRVRIIGSMNFVFKDQASAFIPYRSVVGVETYINESEDTDNQIIFSKTDIKVDLNDASRFYVGNLNYAEGGVLQIGNVVDQGPDHSISFTLNVNGKGARFVTGSKSLLGLNAVVVKATESAPTDLLVNTAFNVNAITINVNDGALDLSRIYDTDDSHANVVVIGDNGDGSPLYTFAYAEVGASVDTIAEVRAQGATVLGGSPIIYLTRSEVDASVSPIVRLDDGLVQVAIGEEGEEIDSERIQAGMIASTVLQQTTTNEVAVTAMELFTQLKTPDAYDGMTPAHDKANAANEDEEFRDSLETIRIGTVAAGKFIRQSIADVFSGIGGIPADARKYATEVGGVFADISTKVDNALQSILSAAQIPF